MGKYYRYIIIYIYFNNKYIKFNLLIFKKKIINILIGYFLSVIFDKKVVALASTGFSLAWSLVLSGIIPNLKDIDGGVLKHFRFLWE